MGVIEQTYTVASRGIGLPDYSLLKPTGQVPVGPVYTSTDIAELAARLRALNTFDRRGNVIWADDFEDGLNWVTTAGGAGSSIALSNETSRSGALSCKMTCGNAVGDSCLIERYSGYPVLSKLGFEISFTLPVAGDFRRIIFELLLDDGTDWLVASVWWDREAPDHRDHTLSVIVPPPPGSVQFDKNFYNYYNNIYCFHTAKLVADFATRKYERFILDHVTYDLSKYDLQIVSGGLVSIGVHCYVSLLVDNRDLGIKAVGYVDDAIITQNEPPNPA